MAKATHPLELAFTKFDDTTKLFLQQVENSFKGVDKIPEVKQPKKQNRKTIYGESPFRKV